ncbi:prepilin-type N-terminal cleavage/methylation domain-containing protein [Azospirillum griseum]|nr:prepilin-type N-terminal cleavage/methylation domain-containing protein [Azospirillum griseum]
MTAATQHRTVVNREAANRAQAGFTLIELLVTMTLLALVLAAAAGGVRMTGWAHDRGTALLAETASFAVAEDVLRRQIGRGFPLAVGLAREAAYVFTGESATLATPLFGDPAREGAGLHLAVFRVEETATGARLLYQEHRLLTRPAVQALDPPLRSATLLDGPYRLAWAYHDGARWLDRWTARQDLPHLVRLSARGRDGRAVWPDIVIRPHSDGDRGCLSAAPLLCRDAPIPP